MPAISHDVLTGSGRLGELRREPLDPPVDADVVDLDPALGEKLLDVSIAQREAQIESHRVLDQGRRETVPAIGDRKHPRSLRPVGGYGQVILTMPP